MDESMLETYEEKVIDERDELRDKLTIAVEALERIFKYEAITTYPFEQAMEALSRIRGQ